MSSNDEETKLLFLLSGSCDVLPSSCIKLRSYLNLHLSSVADQHNLKVSRTSKVRNKACPYCYSPWSADTSSFKLLPMKRLRKKQVQNNNGGNEKPPLNELRNKLILKCKVCTKKSAFALLKKTKVKEKVKEESTEIKKKKKKKDKSCGLAVNLITPTETQFPDVKLEKLFIKKNKGSIDSTPETSKVDDQCSEKPIPISKSTSSKNDSKLPNPFAVQQGILKKRARKLDKLKKAVKKEAGSVVKKSLKDFLTLV